MPQEPLAEAGAGVGRDDGFGGAVAVCGIGGTLAGEVAVVDAVDAAGGGAVDVVAGEGVPEHAVTNDNEEIDRPARAAHRPVLLVSDTVVPSVARLRHVTAPTDVPPSGSSVLCGR
ncbi:hypothetical protein [Amycolatopsis sp.]|uniref:hypothetical protein n=1 Tax=Amycolatopsis sp. TaxID=37632 RepID=UPI00261C0D6B|nr:hypothetical protein [Amycolatopsis sp.]